ncbi:probable rhamnogalacturonate lyase B [Impatiens glandulifera]|uniref:probable rhamnogalacturonate lyase B n=1 Tax=Impatiens glandulifera TaxID=253017 RepID=UPI001FB076A6|nr:probable rhamnogalacturonate lyase B [Impatiens glandulifera]
MDQQVVVMDNGLVNVTLSIPIGVVLGIQYGGIENLLKPNGDNRPGYWDVVWDYPDSPKQLKNSYDHLEGTSFSVVMENENQVEVSFMRTWDNSSHNDNGLVPLNVDKRFVMLRGHSGFYSYAIFERLEEGPDFNMYQGRIVFKLNDTLFQYMAISDERPRIMPTTNDRDHGQVLDYQEAVLLTNPSNPKLKGEVDDKYQYSIENKDNRVHGWICSDPMVGFWMITPSDEFRTGGPLKQDLTSHVGPTVLSMFFSTHYAGDNLTMKFRDGEPWKKVFGPVLIYLNSVSPYEDPSYEDPSRFLWEDAKEQMLIETEHWPYDFPLSEDYLSSNERSLVSGRLLVRDRYINESLITASNAYVGLALPGHIGSWQIEHKGYQFWTQADTEGYFLIKDIRPGNYCLYAWMPGFVGDYKYDDYLNVESGEYMRLGELIYDPPRQGPTLWEIGIPDRSAAEFFVPDPNPKFMNNLTDKFRQYGLWDRYTDLYPYKDLVFTVGVDNYEKDWFFAQVNRKLGNKTYESTTWQIHFDIEEVDHMGNYTLLLALASAHEAELEVRINDSDMYFTTGFIGKDNAIARHGIHGIYLLFIVSISPSSKLVNGRNIVYLKQSRGSSPFRGVMYDYIRLEGPQSAYSN